jgi:peptidoglycan/xylan/chitin deacetylase (PgdA/CDA1 family)
MHFPVPLKHAAAVSAAMKLFCFRFDIDTYLCMRDGVPNLLDLGKRLDARFTFFANMGRSISRVDSLKRVFAAKNRSSEPAARCEKLSNVTKLGRLGFGVTALLNPSVGGYARGSLRRAVEEGHEVGLHGGSNHGSWQNHGANWPTPVLRREVELGQSLLAACGVATPTSFSSPGWQGSPNAYDVLETLGFNLVADEHGNTLDRVSRTGPAEKLRSVPTSLTGEPGGVGYVEHLRALGLEDDDAIARFKKDLTSHSEFAVAYDHPYFAGRRELDMVSKMVRAARDCGYDVVTMTEIADRLGDASK